MDNSPPATLPDKPRVSVAVTVEYSVDPTGRAQVKDVKTLKNDGAAPANLSGIFKQAVNQYVTGMHVTDSHGQSYSYEIKRGDDHHQVAVSIEVPAGNPFVIEPHSERSLVFEYEMSEATTVLGRGARQSFLINNRFGSVTYEFDFATIEYNVKYHIAKLANPALSHRLFLRPALLTHPAPVALTEDRTHFHVEYKFSGDRKSVTYVHMLLMLRPRFWVQSLIAFFLGVF